MMKSKKILLAILGLSMSLSAGLVLAACGDNSAEDHDLTLHKAVAATCTQTGNEEYYSCSDCGKLFADAEAKQEVTLDDVTIAALGHKPVEVAAKEATCTEDGWSAHYECANGCGTYFSDASGTAVIDKDDVVIVKLEHRDIEEVQTDIDAQEGRGWIYHWYCPDCGKYFADSFGDEELSEDEVFFEKIDSVTVTLTGKKAGQISPITAGTATLSGVDYSVNVSGTVETTLTLADVYPISYAIECGDYVGSITFEEGKTSYEAELLYESFTATGDAASSVDLSHMADEDACITISNSTNATALAEFTNIGTLGTTYYLQTNVRIDGASFSEWSDIIYFALSDGGDGDMGVALWMSLATDNIHICRYDESRTSDKAYDGKGNDVTSAAMCSAITSALYSADGLNVRVVRMDNVMTLFYMDNSGEWVRFYSFDTCAGDAQLMLGTSGTPSGASVVFSDIAFSELTYHELQVPTDGQPGYLEHYTDGEGNWYDMNAYPVDESELQIQSVASVEDSVDIDLTDENAVYWMNPLYWEYYQQNGTTATTFGKDDVDDLIGFDVSGQQLVSDQYENDKGISLDGKTKSHLIIDGNIGAYNDIDVTVGSDAKHIAVWTGSWLTTVRVSLYQGDTLISVAEFIGDWDTTSPNKLITFDIDTSDLADEETRTYTLKIEYVSCVATANDARIRLAGIAVLGEERELTYHESGMIDGVLYKAHYTDADGTYYTEDKVRTTKDALVIRYTMEDSVGINLTDEDAVYWMNPLYWEYYQQNGTTATTFGKDDVDDLIGFDVSGQQLVSDQYENDKGISLDGKTKSHLIIDGNIGAYNDIDVTVGSDAKHIAVWTGSWLTTVRVSLYQGDTLISVAEFIGDWDTTSPNKLITFDIDTSDLADEETRTYTLKIEYVSCVAAANEARVRLAGIAVLGEERTLTYHEQTVEGDTVTFAHYTDADGNYYTTDKVRTTLEALRSHYSVEDAADTDLAESDALYWEYYQQNANETTGTVTSKPDADDLIDFDLAKQTLIASYGDNYQGVSLSGNVVTHILTDGNQNFSDIDVTVGKGATRIAVWVGSWLSTVNVSLYDGETLVGTAQIVASWDPASVNQLVTFYLDTSDLADDATKTYTLKIEYVSCVASANDARVRLAGIAVYGEQVQTPAGDEALLTEKK